MRALAKAFGIKPSGVLVAEDVEFRADEAGKQLITVLDEIPADERPAVANMAHELINIAQRTASQMAAATENFAGKPEHVRKLTRLWNSLSEDAKPAALEVLEATVTFHR
jgi:hypothetical protein